MTLNPQCLLQHHQLPHWDQHLLMGGTVPAGGGRPDHEIRVLADDTDSCEFKTFWEVFWNSLVVMIASGISGQASYKSCKVDS